MKDREELVGIIMSLITPPRVVVEPRPTIEELERILNSQDDSPYHLEPNGTVTRPGPTLTAGALADAILAAGFRKQEMVERDESGWVIEGAWSSPSAPEYWVGLSGVFSTDNRKALRFARKCDAEFYAANMLDGVNVRIAEHAWCAAPSPTSVDTQEKDT